MTLEDELQKRLPEITGGLILTLARIMKTLDPKDKKVDHELIKRAKEILDLTM
jgi:hypothetical protein